MVTITLRPLKQQDIPAYLDAFSTAVQQALRVKDKASEEQYIQESLAQEATYFYGIFETGADKLIGAVHIRPPDFSRGQLYVWLNEHYWGQGIIQNALHLAADDYFSRTKALYFDATVDVDNIRSYKALKKAGFADVALKEGQYGKQFIVLLRNKKISA